MDTPSPLTPPPQQRQLWATSLNLWEQFAQKTLMDAALEFENLCLEMTVTATFTRQTELLETIQLIKGYKGAATEQFSQSLLANTDDYLQGKLHRLEEASDKQLELVEDHRLETDIAISNWIRKVYNKYDDPIWAAVGRLFNVIGADTAHYLQRDIALPFTPQSLGLALHQSMAVFDLPNSEALRFIKTYGSCLLQQIDGIYAQINERLDKERLRVPSRAQPIEQMPPPTENDAPDQPQPQAPAPLAEARPAPRSQAETTSKTDDATASHDSLLNSLINTLESEAQANQATPEAQGRPGVTTISGTECYGISRTGQPNAYTCIATDYVSALFESQQSALAQVKSPERNDQLVEQNEAAFFTHLDQLAKESGRNQVTDADMDYINMVGLLFKYVLDDEEIPDKVKNLLAYLHTPYLKLALIDQGFFNNTHHPARILLNTLARAGGRWQEDWRMYARVEEAVSTVLAEFEQDASVFERVNDTFLAFEQSLQERAHKAEQRSLEAARNTERHEKARQQCSEDLRQIIADNPIPESLVEFVFGLWLEVIVFNRLNFGEEANEYQQCLPPIHFLVQSVQPQNNKNALGMEKALVFNRERQTNIKLIAEILKAGGVSLTEAQKHLTSLRNIQQQAFEGVELDCARLQLPIPDENQQLLEETLQEQAKQLAQTPFGTWFEFTDEEPPQHLKLMWRSPITQTCMFVNHIGIKARVLSIADLAHMMADEQCHVVEKDQRSFFERALQSIIRKLQLHKTQDLQPQPI